MDSSLFYQQVEIESIDDSIQVIALILIWYEVTDKVYYIPQKPRIGPPFGQDQSNREQSVTIRLKRNGIQDIR